MKMLAVPVNPADINVIQGVYPIKPKPEELPASPGAEGVGVVVHSPSSEFKEGEWVIPMSRGFGTWQGYISRKPSDLFKVRLRTRKFVRNRCIFSNKNVEILTCCITG